MKKILCLFFGLSVALLIHAQGGFFKTGGIPIANVPGGGGGGGLTIFAYDAQTDNGGIGFTTHTITGIPAGAVLVVTAANEDVGVGAYPDCTVTSSPSLTWTKQADASSSSSGNAEIHTAIFTAGGSITVTSNFGFKFQSAVLYALTGQETTLGGATATATVQSLPSVTLSSTRANSILFCVTSDWSATDGASRTYRATPTERHYATDPVAATLYHYYYDAPTVTSYTIGLTAPNMTSNAGTAVYEIRTP